MKTMLTALDKKSGKKKGEQENQTQQENGKDFQADNPFNKPAQMKKANPFGKKNGDTIQQKSAMPKDVKGQMESSFGTDFSDVKIHTNSEKASKIGAHAFTQGNNVHFAQGKFDPSTKSGKQLLGHELSHVVQQKNGQVKPNIQMKGMAINNEDKHESEADKQGALAAEGKPVQTKMASSNASMSSENAPVQGFFGNLVKKGLNFLKSTVVDMIPQEFKDMIPQELRDMASNMADKGIEAAGGMAEAGGRQLAEAAKSKLATLVPPQMREMIDRIPPEVRQYLEGILEKGGQLAKGALDEGALPSGDQLKQFGKDAAIGGIDLGKQVIPDMIPQDIKDMASKLPPEIQDFAKEKFEQGAEGLKDAVNSGELPDLKQVATNVANEAKDVGVATGTRIATEKATEILQGLPGNVTKAIDSLPEDVKKIIMSLLPENVKKEEVKTPEPAAEPEKVAEAVKQEAATPVEEPKAIGKDSIPPTDEGPINKPAETVTKTGGGGGKTTGGGGKTGGTTKRRASGGTPGYMASTASSRAKRRTKARK